MSCSENCHILLLHILVSVMDRHSENFEACVFGYIGVRTVELATQVLCSFIESIGAPAYL